jgi:hypothetical protein
MSSRNMDKVHLPRNFIDRLPEARSSGPMRFTLSLNASAITESRELVGQPRWDSQGDSPSHLKARRDVRKME